MKKALLTSLFVIIVTIAYTQNFNPTILLNGDTISIRNGIKISQYKDSSGIKECILSVIHSDTNTIIDKYILGQGNRAITNLFDISDLQKINLSPLFSVAHEGDRLILMGYRINNPITTEIISIPIKY